jgi:hypothetical protein
MNPTLKTRPRFGSNHDKSVRKSGLAPPRLFRLRNGIHLQPGGTVLVRRGNRAAADANRWWRLPVPGLFAQGGGATFSRVTYRSIHVMAGLVMWP